MSKRGYKLQEFVAHTANVNCLCIGKKACRLLITGGDDHRVNLWAIGKPSTLMSLCGHASPIESVAFDSAEVLVLAGASSGVTKLWDLEEAKMIRTLTGHRGNCTAVEFHPFGEFFASGSLDTNLRIWDIRKKGCIHTYKGHTGGINTIKFSPDGRWVVSGGFDNVVKVWDLTAGKLLHDFKFHEGHIRSIGFHPLEFLLATGSADRTVKYWDLETFELIGSSIPEATGVRSLLFHPDGKTLFCGLDDSLKVYSWEPIICHDTIDMGWSTLGDLSINEGKLLSCSYYQNAVGVWAADISLLHPYRAEENAFTEFKFNLQGAHAGNTTKSFSDLHPVPDYETREIKNIYIDTASAIPTASRGAGPQHSPTEAIPLVSKDIRDRPAQKSNSTLGMHAKTDVEFGKSFTAPSTIPRRSPERKCTTSHRRESVASTRNNSSIPTKPAHARRPSNSRLDIRSLVVADELGTVDDTKDGLEALDSQLDKNLKFNSRLVREDEARDSSGQLSNIRSVGEKFDRTLSPLTPYDQEKCDKSLNLNKVTSSVKFVSGVAVVPGRTRSLVDKFERRETCEDQKADVAPTMLPETDKTVLMMKAQPPPSGLETKLESAHDDKLPEDLMQNHDVFLSSLKSRLTKIQVVQHFWGKNDIKGAIDALRKLPDHSVQADVVIVLMEKMEILTLDLFSCLLPVLRGLLESKIERHVIISLELLLKFVAVFGGTVCSTISAPPAIGVDLRAEQRREYCSQCFLHLQEIQKLLPTLVRRGGSLARAAQELNLVLQQ